MLCEAALELEYANSEALPASLQIGGVSLSLACATPENLALDPQLLQFSCPPSEADIVASVDWTDELDLSCRSAEFDSGAAWKLFREGNELVFDFVSAALGPAPYKRMRAQADFRNVRISLSGRHLRALCVSPLEYPADELLFTNYLVEHGLGVEVHGCGLIDDGGRAHLFLGHSGAGKSTTARLWHSRTGAEILSDDRIILRFGDGELWMHGTPWHGEGQFASANKGRVGQIFILQHGAANRFVPLSRSRAVGELFARSFPPFHSAEGLERTMEFLNSVATAVPCYQFEFTPDVRSLETVLGFHG
jgi:hypothetical protein